MLCARRVTLLADILSDVEVGRGSTLELDHNEAGLAKSVTMIRLYAMSRRAREEVTSASGLGYLEGEGIHRAKPASGHCGKRETFQRFRILLRYCGCFRAALALSESRAYRPNAAEIRSAIVSSAQVSMCACPEAIIATLSSGAERSRVRMRICLTT